jgi:hypothetical protein
MINGGHGKIVLTTVTFRWLLVYNRFERSMIFQALGFAGGI